MRTILLLALTTIANAQTLPWIDLSGPWRIAYADDPRFAQPTFDDAAWKTVQAPLIDTESRYASRTSRHFWLRRSIQLPPAIAGQPLALTVGSFSEDFEIFVNGKLIATSGPFIRSETRLKRPRTFDLPPIEEQTLTIALHGWIPPFGGTLAWSRIADHGPWLLTGSSNAPRSAGKAAIDGVRLERTLDMVSGVALLTLAIILLLMFANETSRKELMWLGALCAVVGWSRLQVVLSIAVDATPWDYMLIPFIVTQQLLPAVLLLEFTMATLAIRPSWWLRVPVWGAMIPIWFAEEPWREPAYRISQVATTGILVWALARRSNRTTERLLIAFGILACLISAGRQFAAGGTVLNLLPVMNITLGPYRIGSYPVVLAVFSFAMVTVLVRRLLADRSEKQRIDSELEAARTVQQLMFSTAHIESSGYRAEAVYQPAQQVGGDFYFLRETTGGGIQLVTGDVAGKGLRAAMVVSLLIGVLRETRATAPAAILQALNSALLQGGDSGFVTCCAARFTPDGTLVLASAGHPAPIYGNNEINVPPALPLGLDPDASFEEVTLALTPGTQLTFISDGVIEAADPKGELFGFDRTREAAANTARDIARAAQAWGQSDDITVLTVRRVS